ncbi:MAG: class I SAM-dependent RNA methyltransferase, partial [Lentisphaeria bacterium]|nr:class I SAM-dependent RNA methyltransferase [Lentisphaeria bacterium]
AFGGDGVGRTNDCVVFVPFAAIGDELLVEITETKKNFAKGKILAINKPGAGRTEAPCPHYGKCGGCQYQHLTYEAEFAAKTKQLRDCLSRIGGLKELPPLDTAFPAPEFYGYRNKLRLEAKLLNTPPGEPPMVDYGYYALDNKSFMRINGCKLVRQELNKFLPTAIKSDWGKANAHRKAPDKPGALTLRIDSQNEIKYYFGFSPAKLGWFHEELADIPYRVPTGSFWQVNPPVASKLLKTVDSWLQGLNLDTLIDAYCGVGTFACALTPPFKERLLIENDHAATEAAEYNTQQKMLGCQVLTDATEKALPKRLPKYPMATTLVVIDPPRTGCQDAVIETLIANRPKFVMYVSCNPSTLARDLKKLTANGTYSLAKLAMFDMFPRTAHFETAVLLEAK